MHATIEAMDMVPPTVVQARPLPPELELHGEDEAIVFEDMSYLLRGLACASGRDRAVDLVEAHKWFTVAAAIGCREALVHRAEIAAEMTGAQIFAAQRAARDYLRLH